MLMHIGYHSSGVFPANTSHSTNVAVMLVHHLRRWPNITATFVEYLVFAGIGLAQQKLTQCCFIIGQTSTRRWPNIRTVLDQRLVIAPGLPKRRICHVPAGTFCWDDVSKV